MAATSSSRCSIRCGSPTSSIAGESDSGVDEVVCDGVQGPNLVSDALLALRAAGWAAPPVRVEIGKRIPVAAGMGGGSADAAAMLRCAPRLSPVDAGRAAPDRRRARCRRSRPAAARAVARNRRG